MRARNLITAMIVASIVSSYTNAERLDNFVLLDHNGDAHELYYHQYSNAVVLMGQQNSCAADSDSLAHLQAAADAHPDSTFLLVNSTLEDSRETIASHASKLGLTTPVLTDEAQLIGEALKLTSTGEALVVNPKTWEVVYRGGADQIQASLAALAAGSAQPTASAVTGCAIEYPMNDPSAHSKISYAKDIAPMLQDKCVVCHTEGGLGPWAMTSYNMVRGFAPMIREVVRTKRMPPWHADPHIGVWKNDISLTTEEAQTLVHWIEAGAPRGEGPDPLADTQVASVEWPLGEPDMILEIPPYTVPVSGVVDYQFPRVTNPLDTGVWIKAATVVPGDREVVHHILAGTQEADASQLRRDSGIFDNFLIGYAPGNESNRFPADTGVYVPPGGDFLFQMHYTPVGRETVDRSKIGLYFHKEQPENFYRQSVVINPAIKIPPNTARHAEVAYYQFDKEALLHDLVPHAHYRGVASKFELERADGSRETILSVPKYDFNWQRTYEFVEPKRIPAGARLVHTTWYDNSKAHAKNPDPDREVPWGLQSWDEMLYGGFSFTYVDETTEAPIHDDVRSQTAQFVGFLDQNIDGKVSWRELPRDMKKRLVQGFKAVDANGDGALDMDEMVELTIRQREARAKRQAEQASSTEAGNAAQLRRVPWTPVRGTHQLKEGDDEMGLKYLAPDSSTETILAALDEDGAAVLEDVIDASVVKRMTDEVMPFIETTPMGGDDFVGRKTQRTGALVARTPTCRELIMNASILDAAHAFLGPYTAKIILHLTQTIYIHPGNQAQAIHRDRLAWGKYLPREIEPQFNTIWALTDFTKENGATRCVPGSHRWEWGTQAEDDQIVQAEMSAGSVFLYSGSVLHSGGENRSDESRLGVNLTYCLGWLRQEENQYLSCPPDIAKDLDPQLQELLGYTQGEYALGYFTDPKVDHENYDIMPPEMALGRKPSKGAYIAENSELDFSDAKQL